MPQLAERLRFNLPYPLAGDREALTDLFERVLAAARQHLAASKQQLTDNHTARRTTEKDVALQQGRLSKFRDQLMAVKTNREYQAIQHEIAIAENEVKALEEKLLEWMIEGDERAARAKQAEAALAAEQKAVDADRRAMTAEHAEIGASLERLAADRAVLVAALDKHVFAIFELVARRRNGVAVAEARGGICTICHVRLRPQLFNTVLRNEEIVQCDSCNRILYSTPTSPAVAPDDVGPTL